MAVRTRDYNWLVNLFGKADEWAALGSFDIWGPDGLLDVDKAKAFLEPLTKDPELSPYAVTRLYLMDNAPTNVAVNGGFELRWNEKPGKSAEPDWLPFGQRGWNWWKFPSSQARVWTDETEAHGGKASAVLAENQLGCCILTQWRAECNARYCLSFWAKRNDDNGGGIYCPTVLMKKVLCMIWKMTTPKHT